MKNNKTRRIRPFQKILIANRGEISIRIQRACSELGITSVAIYSEEDYLSLHRVKADESYLVGKNKGPVEAYLDIRGIIEIAKQNKVDAIHPGYGFLSENAELVRECDKAGITFIGPSAESILLMGDKAEARRIAQKVNVPVIPGTEEFVKTVKEAKKYAKKIQYPVLIKAAFGGGGRGVRAVYNESEIEENFNEARSEAKTAFGNDALFIEKYVQNPKHIEVQILADRYGNIVHLFERDCSVQRRYQKVIEFAPSLTISDETKKKLYSDAIKISEGCNYSNAGTVEFLVEEDEEYYFIEMNPRIQVEHTVTELVTGVDIVRAQIRIAEGYKLTDKSVSIPKKPKLNGFAIQCRITTEDPKNNFIPDIGTINDYRSPGGFGVRLDAASAFVGAAITPYYDSMLVKLTTFANDYESALSKMVRALNEFRIRGVKNNIPFLINVLSHPVFVSGKCRTTFLDEHREVFNIEERSDNISKILDFIGDVIVNRKYEKPVKWKNSPPQKPKIPDTSLSEIPMPVHRQVFLKKGAEGLSKWILKQERQLVTDTTFRDAHQSLLATRMRTYDIANVASSTAVIGKDIFSYEMWGGATFDVCMRFLHEDPWLRLLKLRQEMPNSMFQMLLRGSNAVGYKNYPDNVVVEFINKAAKHGIDIFRVFDCFNWVSNMKLSIKTVIETGKVCESAICYSGDITNPDKKKYTLQYYIDLAGELKELGSHIIAIKDMAGLCKPYAAEQLIKAIKKETGLPVHFHTHATSGNGEATILKAVEAGADIVDLAISSMSGTTAQPSLNAIAAALKGHKRDTMLDVGQLNRLAAYWENVREFYAPFETDMKASNADVYDYEIPGGQYTNLRAQAKSLGLGEQWEDVKKKYAEVNQLFGDIIKVTPSSKVVGDLALYLTQNGINTEDVVKKSDELSFPVSTVDLMKGQLGQPLGGFPPKVRDAVLKGEKYITKRPGNYIKDVDIDKELKILQEKYDGKILKKDVISHLLYPAVFEEYFKHQKLYGDVSVIPTELFYYGMEPGDEINIITGEGKQYLVKLFGIGEIEHDGRIPMLFEVNGHPRPTRVKDLSAKTDEVVHEKADTDVQGEIGSPLAGKIMKLFISKGDKVEKGQTLFNIEAMKMQTNIKSNYKGTVEKLPLKEGENVGAGDLVVKLKVTPP